MSLPADPKVLQVADALVERLALISRSNDTSKWHCNVAMVELGPTMALPKRSGNVIFVELVSWSDTPIGVQTHEAECTFVISGFVNNSRQAQREVHKLAADIIKAIAEKDVDRLNGLVVSIWTVSYTASTEFVEQSGKGRADVVVRATVRWTHGSP